MDLRLRRRSILGLAAAGALAVGAVTVAPASSQRIPLPTKYRFTNYDYPGAVGTTLFGINDLGQVAGYYSSQSLAGDIRNKPIQGFVLNVASMRATRTVAPAGLRSRIKGMKNVAVVGVSQDGRVVGSFTNEREHNYGFIRSRDGKRFTLIDVPRGSGTNAFSMNAKGQVAGFYFDRASSKAPSANDRIVHGFIRSPSGKYTTFDHPAGVGKTFASGIDRLGRVVGHYIGAGGVIRGFTRSQDGRRYTTFSHPRVRTAGATCAQAFNRVGEIAGFFITPTGGTHGYVRSADGKRFNVIDHPRGVGKTFVFGINDAGQVAGYYVDGKGNNHGFIAAPM